MWRLYLMKIILLSLVITSVIAISNDKASVDGDYKEFKYCLRKSLKPNVRECIGKSAISFLQRFDEKDNFTLIDNFVATKDDKISGRSLVNMLDTDPVDFRGILENAGAVFSQRALEWHMDSLYPGLMFKIGPSADSNSVAEFILDPEVNERNFNYEEASTARVLAKQYLLPFLLGLKFNLVALVPLLFTAVCLLLKKSLFIVKLVIYVSSLLGIGGVAGTLGGAGLGSFFSAPFFGGGIGGGHHIHGHAADHHHLGGSFGNFPGKNTVFSSSFHDNDEFYNQNSPYKRQDRKVNFQKPREGQMPASTITTTTTSSTILAAPNSDNFYDYEKRMQDHSSKPRYSNGKLGPSAYDYDEDEMEVAGVINLADTATSRRFKTAGVSDNSGWKVINFKGVI